MPNVHGPASRYSLTMTDPPRGKSPWLAYFRTAPWIIVLAALLGAAYGGAPPALLISIAALALILALLRVAFADHAQQWIDRRNEQRPD